MKEVKTKFWKFDQNNSGGYFVEDAENGVCEIVIIEALNAKDAFSRLEKIGEKVDGFWNYCSCCGERWSSWIDDSDGTIVPEHYGTPIEEVERSMFRSEIFVHYFDGSFKKFTLKEEKS